MTLPLMLPKLSWFGTALKLKGSVIPAVMSKVLLCSGFGVLISVLADWKWVSGWPTLGNVVPSIVLGLLLVFRTNTAYERFWEGRKAWGTLVNTIRNLTRRIWVFVEKTSPSDRTHKVEALKLSIGFAIAMKFHLRQEALGQELQNWIGDDLQAALRDAHNPPLMLAFWIEDYLQQQYRNQRIDLYQVTALTALLDKMVESLGACERILKTPMPMAYAIHLKQLLLIYCLLLPLQMVGEIGYWTGPIVGLVSFTLFGIEEIGLEIENPFGLDDNDLPLDEICRTMGKNVEHLMQLKPSAYRHEHERYEDTVDSVWAQPSL
jgi:ion channel-forming bestrophin family protein